jgi:hypothetical protein
MLLGDEHGRDGIVRQASTHMDEGYSVKEALSSIDYWLLLVVYTTLVGAVCFLARAGVGVGWGGGGGGLFNWLAFEHGVWRFGARELVVRWLFLYASF